MYAKFFKCYIHITFKWVKIRDLSSYIPLFFIFVNSMTRLLSKVTYFDE